jgi:hypothetical protein
VAAVPARDLPVAEGQVGVLIRGYEEEEAIVVEATRLAALKPRGLAFIAMRPPAPSGLLLTMGIDAEKTRREGEMAQRRFIRRIAEPWLEGLPYTLAIVGRPFHRSAVFAAEREGCDTLVISDAEARRARRTFWRAAACAGLRVIVVPIDRRFS